MSQLLKLIDEKLLLYKRSAPELGFINTKVTFATAIILGRSFYTKLTTEMLNEALAQSGPLPNLYFTSYQNLPVIVSDIIQEDILIV